MRVALFNDAVELGGAERYFADLATGVAAAGHELHIALSDREGSRRQYHTLARLTASIVLLPSSIRPARVALASYIGAWRFLRALRPDIAHFSLHHADSCRYWIEAARRLHVPLLVSEHFVTDGYLQASRLTRWFKTRAYRAAQAILFNSHAARAAALSAWRGAPPRAVVIPYGVRLDEFRQNRGGRTGLRVCFLGRLVAQKNPLAVVRAFEAVAAGFPEATLHIYGDGPLRQTVADAAASSPAADRVFLHGHTQNVADALAAVDILVLPSWAENQPYSVLEAMASGCAVIATAVGDLPNLLSDGAGVVVPPGDADALSAALRRLLSDPQAALETGRRAQRRVAEFHSLDTMIGAILDHYDRVLSETRHSELAPP